MTTIPNISYQAPWTLENYHLQNSFQDILSSPFRTTLRKAIDCAKRLISVSLETCLAPLQRQYAYWFVGTARAEVGLFKRVETAWEERWSTIREDTGYIASKVHLTTPDMAALPPAPWYCYGNQKNLPTVIVLNPFIPPSSAKDPEDNTPSLAMGQECDWMLIEGEKRRYNLLFVDARRPVQRFNDHLLDASTAFEFLRAQGVEQISIFGYCAGGVAAVKLGNMYKVRAVTYNCFTEFGAFYRNSSYIRASTRERICCPGFIQSLVAILAPLVGWSPNIHNQKHDVVALQHVEDELIPSVAQIPDAIKLLQIAGKTLPPHRGHWASLTECIGADEPGSKIAFDALIS